MARQPDSYSIRPIDVDFAGWSLVPEGQHSHWAIVHNPTETLRGYWPDRARAEEKLGYILSKFITATPPCGT
jgi:hypothetical protein